MKKLPIIFFVAVMVAFAALWEAGHQNELALRAENDSLRQQLGQVEQLQADNERLSNSLARADVSFSAQQQSDLLKLRGEVTELRSQTNQLRHLQQQNQQLRERIAAAAQSAPAHPAKTPPEVPPQDIFAKENWAYAGYATPEAALQSAAWALAHGDRENYFASFTPELAAIEQKAIAQKNFSDYADERLRSVTGFRILERNPVSADEMKLKIYVEGEDRDDNIFLRRINGQWKAAIEPEQSR